MATMWVGRATTASASNDDTGADGSEPVPRFDFTCATCNSTWYLPDGPNRPYSIERRSTMSFEYDPFGPEARQNPYPAYRRMLEDETLRFYRNDERQFVAVTRYDDAVEVLRDWKTFTSSRGVDIDESSSYFGEGVFLEEDPPLHKLLRNVVHSDFSPKSIRNLLEGPTTTKYKGLI